jgi:hypothetical protein
MVLYSQGGTENRNDYISTTTGTGGYTMSQYFVEPDSQAFRDGLRQGFQLAKLLHAQGRDDDLERALHDKEYREQLFQEFDLSE